MHTRGFVPTAIVIAMFAAASSHAQPWLPTANPWRAIDGYGNNTTHLEWGSTNVHLMRLTTVSYADGISDPAVADRPDMPGGRAISNAVCAQPWLIENSESATNFLWQWGQFLDHDLDLTDVAVPMEPFPIPVPVCDETFDPDCDGDKFIPVTRSIYDTETGTSLDNPRQQINQITAFIDASNVYGSDYDRATALRLNNGTGRLRMSPGSLLPYNYAGLPNLGGPDSSLFLAGDIRCNEQVSLTCMHTLFVREHNRIAQHIEQEQPDLTGEEIYQHARARVGALIQVITYQEFLPTLLGVDALPPYQGYDPEVNPNIANIFSGACYRVGHTLLSPTIMRLDADGEVIPEGNLALRDAFFAPERLTEEGGIEPILRGLAAAMAQEVDNMVIDDVRNFLFLAPDPAGLDLPAINMQRGRDHGLPRYNQARFDLDLEPANGFDDISSSIEVQEALASVYDHVDDVDVWLGAVSEDHLPGAMVGELIMTVLTDQFTRVRDGDRFWYENVFSGDELAELQQTTLADVIRRNTTIGDELHDDVFHMPPDPDGETGGELAGFELVLHIIVNWGGTDEVADVDDNGVVDMADLLAALLG